MYIKNEYDKKYKKDNYSQFKIYLKKEEKEKLDKELKKNNLKGAEFVRLALKNLENGKLKKEETDG